MVTDASSARERIRLILDRANSPWLTNSEINGFIEMAINEYTRERVGMFGANQKLRDDFGGFVKSVQFQAAPTEIDESPSNDVFVRQYLAFTEDAIALDTANMGLSYPGGEWSGTGSSAGTVCAINDKFSNNTDIIEDDVLCFGYLLDIKVSFAGALQLVKIMSLDDSLSTNRDPFHAPTQGNYHAIRVNDVYIVRPSVSQSSVFMTYVSNNNDVENIVWLPIHGREEVCNIAARKILGTVADERHPAVDNEIRQLEGK